MPPPGSEQGEDQTSVVERDKKTLIEDARKQTQRSAQKVQELEEAVQQTSNSLSSLQKRAKKFVRGLANTDVQMMAKAQRAIAEAMIRKAAKSETDDHDILLNHAEADVANSYAMRILQNSLKTFQRNQDELKKTLGEIAVET